MAAPVAEWLRTLIFSVLNHPSSHRCGFEPSSACVWSGGFFSGISRFRPTLLTLTQPKMSEIILTGRKTQIKK